MDIHLWVWFAFIALILALLALDLFVFHREAHDVGFAEATKYSIFWISLGLLFAVVVFVAWGATAGGEYLAGYLIEKALSVDNIFVFALIFRYFGVPTRYQHRVLFWGIIGALVFRAIFIAAGVAALERFHWVVYVLGVFLIYTGIKMATHDDEEVHPERNPAMRLFRRFVPTTPDYAGQNLVVRHGGRLMATPLMAVLVLIETTDVVFAVDSIPAILAVTREPFIVFSSNAFAILGLRALYFMLAGMLDRFVYLKVGLAFVLVFVGVKMVIVDWYHVPIWASLSVIAIAITVSVVLSLRKTAPGAAGEPDAEGGSGEAKPPKKARCVVVATDGSDASGAAVRLVGRWVRRDAITVRVVSVNSFDAALAQAKDSQRYDPAASRERASGFVKDAVAQLDSVGLRAEGTVLDGSPAGEILAAAATEAADLVVIGAGRKSRVDRLVLGSVSTAVLHSAERSALIVHECGDQSTVSVLIASDGSPAARNAIDLFADLADPARVRVTVLAVESGAGKEPANMEAARARLHDAGFEVALEQVAGDPAKVITARAEAYDMAVVGSRGLGAVKRAFLGSVSEKLAREAQATLIAR